MHASLDAPGTRCAFETHGCTALVAGRGGFDQHHPVPVELGGDPHQPLMPLCPIHHRRQHSLIRYLIKCLEANTPPDPNLLRRFRPAERDTARNATQAWDRNGRPAINGWPCPAAHL